VREKRYTVPPKKQGKPVRKGTKRLQLGRQQKRKKGQKKGNAESKKKRGNTQTQGNLAPPEDSEEKKKKKLEKIHTKKNPSGLATSDSRER